MKEKDQRNYRKFSRQFILTVLLDYYSSGSSKRSIVRKYGLSGGLLYGWLRKYESESLSLPTDMSELESKVYMARKKHKSERPAAVRPSTEEERLREEIARLRKALAYSELRNEALNEIIKISKEKYGIDLLKKLAPGSRQPSGQASRSFHRVPERTVWQDTRGLLFGVAREARGP